MLPRGIRPLITLRPVSLGTRPSFVCSSRQRGLASAGVLPQLTKDRYPHVERGKYAKLDENHLGFFKDLLGPDRVITDPFDCERFNVDWIKNVRVLGIIPFPLSTFGIPQYSGSVGLLPRNYERVLRMTYIIKTLGYSQCVLKPKSTEEVSKILSFCNDSRVAVCPQGGNTGLVGGSVPVFDEVVVWTGLMNNVISIDDTSGILVCQAGCILEHLDNHLAEKNLMMPLDLGAKGSCHVGGNVSTNAGGLRLLRYGNLHGSVLGVEAVKANGEIVDCLSTLKKDNTGYHLKHLFIGSEGTLGIITKIAIQCPPKPKAVNLAFLGLKSFQDVLKILKKAKQDLGEILSSCEMIDESSLDSVTTNLKLKSPLSIHPFYMLVETHGSNNEHDEEKLNTFLEDIMEEGLALDGTSTKDPSKMKAIWDLRESITEGLLQDGYAFKYDISLPTENFYSLVPVLRERVGDIAVRVCGYGHIGDGNIHLNVTAREFSQEMLNRIEPFVFEYTSKLRGSVSAEHGIGFKKPKYVHFSKSKESIELMKQLKSMMDPNGILNPYKVLPN